MALIEFTNKGIYCPQADVYIDPWKPVRRALITHGHADHSRWGNKHYLCSNSARPVIEYRLGAINIESLAYGETTMVNGVRISFHPAGHIIGSAQIRLEYKGEIWVISGDYKVQNDGLSEAFEPVKCHNFITESTFGLPIYKWKAPSVVANEINEWWQQNKEDGKVSVIGVYALGKAQRIIHSVDNSIGRIYTHGAIENTNEVIRKQGIPLPTTHKADAKVNKRDYVGSLVLATPASMQTNWVNRLGNVSTALASGWMTLRTTRRRRSVDKGFIMSDHADWDGLNSAIKATEAERVFVTHGSTKIFKRWLNGQGIWAEEVSTKFEGERLDVEEEVAEE